MNSDLPLIRNGEIIFHFDVKDHSLPLGDFIATAKATKQILDCFNRELFRGDQIKLQLYVMPSEQGGFIQILKVAIWFIAVGGVTLTILESDFGKGYVKGLTGHEPRYWSERLGEAHRNSRVGEVVEEMLSIKTYRFIENRPDDLKDMGLDEERFKKPMMERINSMRLVKIMRT